MKRKYEKMVMLSAAVIRLDVLHGNKKWKVTDLARFTKTSRSRIYESLGKNKNEMLLNSLKILLKELYGLSEERKKMDQEQGNFKGFLRSRQLVMDSPELLSFYFRNRGKKDAVGDLIRLEEKKFLDEVSKQSGIKDPMTVLFVRTMVHGISLAPFLTDNEVSHLMRMLGKASQSWASAKTLLSS